MAGEFDPTKHPRDEHGLWIVSATPEEIERQEKRWEPGGVGADATPDPRAEAVGGSEWNQETAARLENEYAAARPVLDKIAHDVVGGTAEAPEPEEDDEEEFHAGVPDEWDNLSNTQQSDAKDQYINNNLEAALDSEVESWQEGGQALNDAKYAVSKDGDWIADAINEWIEQRIEDGEPRTPYNASDLIDAVKVNYDGQNGDGTDDPEITFDNDYLQNPIIGKDKFSKEQMMLPGMGEPPDPSSMFTKELRDSLTDRLILAFNDEAKTLLDNGKIEPPDDLKGVAEEYLDDSWHGMDDDEKFEWTKQHTSIIPEEDHPAKGVPLPTVHLQFPATWDPTNETTGENYKRTQTMSHAIFRRRAVELLHARGFSSTISESVVAGIDDTLWKSWLGSSTSHDGQIMQVAAAQELGGHMRERKTSVAEEVPDFNPKEYAVSDKTPNLVMTSSMTAFDLNHPVEVGHSETLQDGLIIAKQDDGSWKSIALAVGSKLFNERKNKPLIARSERIATELGTKFTRLPDVRIERNGLASWTYSSGVANSWNGVENKVPLGIDIANVIDDADNRYARIGGFAGIKALMRAKWETTQYMLDRANQPIVDLFRGLIVSHVHQDSPPKIAKLGNLAPEYAGALAKLAKADDSSKAGLTSSEAEAVDVMHSNSGYHGIWTELHTGTPIKYKDKMVGPDDPLYPSLKAGKMVADVLKKEAAAVGMEDRQSTNRIVLRSAVPRTAVISVPAYGANTQSEREAVVVGTAWRAWDAWSERAPEFKEIDLQGHPVESEGHKVLLRAEEKIKTAENPHKLSTKADLDEPEHEALKEKYGGAVDAWYALHPDGPKVKEADAQLGNLNYFSEVESGVLPEQKATLIKYHGSLEKAWNWIWPEKDIHAEDTVTKYKKTVPKEQQL